MKGGDRMFGIWKTRLGFRSVYEGWVHINGEPVLFNSERGALEYMHDIELKNNDRGTEYEVRRYKG